MAKKKAKKTGNRAVRQSKKSGSRSWKLILLVTVAALAAVLYAIMSPSGIFKPGSSASVSGRSAVKADSAKDVKVEPKKSEGPVEAAKVEPKPAPVAKVVPKPVVPVVPATPPAPVCSGQPLSLSDIQGRVGDASWRFIDVRPVEQFTAGNIPGAINIPAADFDAAFARESAGLSQAAGLILYGEGFGDPSVVQVCTKMTGKSLPKIYLFREGWSRWPQVPAQ